MKRPLLKIVLVLGALLLGTMAYADLPNITAVTTTTSANGSTTYDLNLKILIVMTLITILPTLLMTMTAFTRIIVVLAILRQALGVANVPTNQILLGMALFLTLFVMTPTLQRVNDEALQPYLSQKMSDQDAIQKAMVPFHDFMLKQTRREDLSLFVELSGAKQMPNPQQISMLILMPAFLTSELKTAFQMGFILFLPFLIIDLVVSSILMSMGMMMLSPLVISLPFKIMLFVMVNGWVLIVSTLASSFAH